MGTHCPQGHSVLVTQHQQGPVCLAFLLLRSKGRRPGNPSLLDPNGCDVRKLRIKFRFTQGKDCPPTHEPGLVTSSTARTQVGQQTESSRAGPGGDDFSLGRDKMAPGATAVKCEPAIICRLQRDRRTDKNWGELDPACGPRLD